MKTLPTALAAAGLVVGLVGPAAPASAAPTCADPAHPIASTQGFDVSVGTTKVTKVDLGLSTARGCDVDAAVATVSGPSRTFRVVLHQAEGHPDTLPSWTGSLRLDPKDLRNADAGTWTIRYEVSGQTDESSDNVGHLRRATRVTFDAGPEPVRHDSITFKGKLQRASWDSHRYRGLSRDVDVQRFDQDGVEYVDVVTVTTRADGRFRTTTTFPGANTYWASYDGDDVSGASTSRRDRVDAR